MWGFKIDVKTVNWRTMSDVASGNSSLAAFPHQTRTISGHKRLRGSLGEEINSGEVFGPRTPLDELAQPSSLFHNQSPKSASFPKLRTRVAPRHPASFVPTPEFGRDWHG
jgi:hypothetical protein